MGKIILTLFLSLLIIFSPVVILAGQEVDSNLNNIQQTQTWTGYNVRIGGGPEIGWLRLNLGELNSTLT